MSQMPRNITTKKHLLGEDRLHVEEFLFPTDNCNKYCGLDLYLKVLFAAIRNIPLAGIYHSGVHFGFGNSLCHVQDKVSATEIG
jgi:hypothetical protein